MRLLQYFFPTVQLRQRVNQKLRAWGIPLAILFTFILSTASATPAGVVRGTVTSKGAPLVGAVVRLLDLNRTNLTDQNGAFEFRSVPDGTYHIFVRMLGYETATKEVAVKNDTISIDVSIRENPI